jgi:hypothetical protein
LSGENDFGFELVSIGSRGRFKSVVDRENQVILRVMVYVASRQKTSVDRLVKQLLCARRVDELKTRRILVEPLEGRQLMAGDSFMALLGSANHHTISPEDLGISSLTTSGLASEVSGPQGSGLSGAGETGR